MPAVDRKTGRKVVTTCAVFLRVNLAFEQALFRRALRWRGRRWNFPSRRIILTPLDKALASPVTFCAGLEWPPPELEYPTASVASRTPTTHYRLQIARSFNPLPGITSSGLPRYVWAHSISHERL